MIDRTSDSGINRSVWQSSGALKREHTCGGVLANFIPEIHRGEFDYSQIWRRTQTHLQCPLQQFFLSAIIAETFGEKDKHIREQLSESLEQIIMGSFSVPINMPGTGFRTAKLARWKMDQLIQSLMEKCRNDLQKRKEIVCSNKDLLSVLLTAKDESGEQFSDKEIVDNISLFLHAAYDTTV
eukprot:Gb_10583 [translate_table: standard]